MYSNKFCGSKAVDLFLKLNLPIAILLNTDEAADMLHFLKPLFLRIVHFCKDSTAENVQISVLLNNHDADISSVVENYLQNIWDNLIGNVTILYFAFSLIQIIYFPGKVIPR